MHTHTDHAGQVAATTEWEAPKMPCQLKLPQLIRVKELHTHKHTTCKVAVTATELFDWFNQLW